MHTKIRIMISIIALASFLTGCTTPGAGTPAEQAAAKEQRVKAAISTAGYVFIRTQKDTATAANAVGAIADAIPEDGTLTASDVVAVALRFLPAGNPDAAFLVQQLASVFDQYSLSLGQAGTVAAVKAGLVEAGKPFAGAQK